MLTIDKIHVKYPDGQKALDDVSFSIQDGHSVAIVGANGAGKSTLLLSIVGVILAQSGHITIDNIPLERQTLDSIRQRVGMVFQNPDDQLFMTRMEECRLELPISCQNI